MTLRQLAENRIQFYRRETWGPGEFVHCEAFLEDAAAHKVRGYRACFCQAPIPGNHPDCDDDRWLAYEGPETAALQPGPAISQEFFASGISTELLAALGNLTRWMQQEGREAVKEKVPDVADFQIGEEMRG